MYSTAKSRRMPEFNPSRHCDFPLGILVTYVQLNPRPCLGLIPPDIETRPYVFWSRFSYARDLQRLASLHRLGHCFTANIESFNNTSIRCDNQTSVVIEVVGGVMGVYYLVSTPPSPTILNFRLTLSCGNAKC